MSIFLKRLNTSLFNTGTILVVFFISNLLFSLNTYSQGEIDSQKKIFYRNEKTFAVLLNTNGIAGNYRFAKRLDGYKKNTVEVDFGYIKHPKEVKIQNPYILNAPRYVFGKTNSFYFLRAGIGRQKEIFSKFDLGGLSIIQFWNIGPTLGFLKPIYYEVRYTLADGSDVYVVEKFNTSIHNSGDIQKRAPYTIGFDEMSLLPGGYFKYGFSFDYSNVDRFVRAIEIGAIIDIFAKKAEIMATEENNQFFVSLFVSYRFGKVHSKKEKNLIDITE